MFTRARLFSTSYPASLTVQLLMFLGTDANRYVIWFLYALGWRLYPAEGTILYTVIGLCKLDLEAEQVYNTFVP